MRSQRGIADMLCQPLEMLVFPIPLFVLGVHLFKPLADTRCEAVVDEIKGQLADLLIPANAILLELPPFQPEHLPVEIVGERLDPSPELGSDKFFEDIFQRIASADVLIACCLINQRNDSDMCQPAHQHIRLGCDVNLIVT